MVEKINCAVEEVSSTKNEYHKIIEGLPGHSLVVRPREPKNAYIMDYRNL